MKEKKERRAKTEIQRVASLTAPTADRQRLIDAVEFSGDILSHCPRGFIKVLAPAGHGPVMSSSGSETERLRQKQLEQ